MRHLALLLVVLVVTSSSAQLTSAPIRPSPTPLTLAAEVGGGFAVGVGGYLLGAVCGQKLLNSRDANMTSAPQLFVGLSTAAVGVAGGTFLTGTALRQGGKFLPTLACTATDFAFGTGMSVVGGLLASGSSWGSARAGVGIALLFTGMSVIMAAPFVATGEYNASRPPTSTAGRIAPGSVAIGSVRDAEGTAHPSVVIRLPSIRL